MASSSAVFGYGSLIWKVRCHLYATLFSLCRLTALPGSTG